MGSIYDIEGTMKFVWLTDANGERKLINLNHATTIVATKHHDCDGAMIKFGDMRSIFVQESLDEIAKLVHSQGPLRIMPEG